MSRSERRSASAAEVALAPDSRLRSVNAEPIRPEGDHVLYWMTAHRRLGWSFALDHAIARAQALDRPLIILEGLRAGYPHASPRLHRFVLDGMAEHAQALEGGPLGYYPYVERSAGEGKGLLAAISRRACLVIGDDYPAFFLPHMTRAAATKLEVRLELVDANGLVPLEAPARLFSTAHSFRRWLQKNAASLLAQRPHSQPLSRLKLRPAPRLGQELTRRWPAASPALLRGDLRGVELAGAVPPSLRGGTKVARQALKHFIESGLPRYAEDKSHPDLDATSGLSPWLHFGHLASLEVLWTLLDQEGWTPARLQDRTDGSRAGFWGVDAATEAFIDQLITWREVGFNFCHHRDDADQYSGTPDWAQATLKRHMIDERPALYTFAQLEKAETADPVWNAAQRQLLGEGRIHNYLRMVWGKRVLEWTRSPAQAFEWLVRLNDRYALDGRDPNSYSGIGWIFGRYDRPWGPEREVYGTVRYMSSANTLKKLELKRYLTRFG